jgi:caffeoyl-CoA O-methyltransferase
VNPETTRLAESFWKKSPHGKKIKPVLGPAMESLEKVKGPFELVFIDADKTGYLGYLKRCLDLISPRGVILVDNCLWSGRVLNPTENDPDTRAIKAFNDYVVKDSNLESTLLPLRDGVYVIRKR